MLIICKICGCELSRPRRKYCLNCKKTGTRLCLKKYAKKYYEEHSESIIRNTKKYYYNNKSIIIQNIKNYYYKNKKIIHIKRKKYYKNNPEKYDELLKYYKKYLKIYSQTEHGRLNRNKCSRKRRLKRLLVKETFTDEEFNEKLNDTNGICPLCEQFIGKNKLTLDHIFPISKAPDGFIYTINDIQFLCKSCNSKKGSKLSYMR